MIEILLVIMALIAFTALNLRDMLVAVIMVSVFSFVSCLVFFLLHAPDVALTEAAVGTGIGTVVLIWIVHKTERMEKP
jgi:uncharacterized MnhB-related membrane protein